MSFKNRSTSEFPCQRCNEDEAVYNGLCLSCMDIDDNDKVSNRKQKRPKKKPKSDEDY